MFKLNPGPATTPNATIDLTSLLDVIFIFLFVIILAYAKIAAQKEVAYEEQIAQLQQELKEHQAESYELDTIIQSYEASVQQYQELDNLVKKITIYCNYDHNDPSTRTIKILMPGNEPITITLSKDNSDTGFNRLEAILSEFIEENKPNTLKDEDNKNASADGVSFIIVFLSLNEIQRGDREKIDAIATGFMNQYENVYYRKTRTD